MQYTGLTKDGHEFPSEFSVSVIKDSSGNPIGFVSITRDITERKKAEEEMKMSLGKVHILNEKLGVVGKLTRHDVRNKLNAIMNNVYLAKTTLTQTSEAEPLRHLRTIESAIDQVERIFDFAKTYEMIGVEELSYVDVERSVEEAVMQFSDFHGMKVMNDCHGLTVLADSLVRQLFCNLIDNSLKYGEKISQIRVYYEKTRKNQLKLVYEDDGVGIPKAEKEKIFREGYGKGTGYGLFLIRKMCQVYGWTIRETGKQGKGAKFTITIPKMGENEKINYKLH
jgi:signal transduction histidine kinase